MIKVCNVVRGVDQVSRELLFSRSQNTRSSGYHCSEQDTGFKLTRQSTFLPTP